MNPKASYLASSISLAIALSAPAALAQQTNEADLEKISVIGSRLSVRSATESTAPVDIISSTELQATGMTETSRALQFLVPSFNFPTSSITDGSDAVRPASLRGLSPDHTLVLINGKRRHGSALVHLNGTMGRGSSNVDLNAIPMSAIKRIEILRDGAAAQYGSDAIAGVINLVLNDNVSGGHISLNGGQTFEGDGEQYKISSSQGIRIAEDGFVTISAEYHHKNKTNRAGLDPRQQYADINGQPDPREATVNRLNHGVGDASFENLAFMVNAGYQLTDSELYAFADLSQRKTKSGAFFRRPLDARNIPEIYPDGFLPEIAPETNDHAITLGYKFQLADWQLDLSANTGSSHYQYYVNNSINASLGPTSPTSADAGGMRNNEQNLNLDASKLFAFVNESDLVLSGGIAYRKNSYKISQGDEVSYTNYGYQNKAAGMQGFGGFTPESTVDESRNNVGIYVEVENKLTDQFNWSAAVRQERYSDFGNNTSWKVAGRYELTPNWAVRSTFNSGFRAPSVQQLYFSNLSTLFVTDPNTGILSPVESGTFNNTSAIVKALGQGELKSEQSRSISLGVTYQGDNGVTFTLDSYRIDIDDRIILTGSVNRTNPIIDALLGANSAESVRFFTNAVDSRTQGVEAVVAYQLPASVYGDVKLSLSAQYNDSDIKRIKVPALLGGLEQDLFNDEEKTRLTKANPKNSFSAGITHSYGDFTTNLRLNHFGPYSLHYAAGDYEYSAKTIADVSVNYAYSKQLDFTLGVNNLFDTYPNKQPASEQFNGIFKYPNTNAPFGFNGGYYFAEARYSF